MKRKTQESLFLIRSHSFGDRTLPQNRIRPFTRWPVLVTVHKLIARRGIDIALARSTGKWAEKVVTRYVAEMKWPVISRTVRLRIQYLTTFDPLMRSIPYNWNTRMEHGINMSIISSLPVETASARVSLLYRSSDLEFWGRWWTVYIKLQASCWGNWSVRWPTPFISLLKFPFLFCVSWSSSIKCSYPSITHEKISGTIIFWQSTRK